MLRKSIAYLLAALLALIVGTGGQGLAASQTDSELSEQVKIKVIRLGVGEKARVTVRMKDGTKMKGYISQAGESEFVVRDRKTDAPTNIFYKDVAKVESNRGHSTLTASLIGAGIAAVSVITVIGLIIAAND
jgi:hypothetical protein